MFLNVFRPDLLAVYRLTLKTNWDEDSFPRQVRTWKHHIQSCMKMSKSYNFDERTKSRV